MEVPSEALLFERRFRNEVAHGCDLVRQLEHNLKEAPLGSLAETILSNGPMPEFSYALAKIVNIFTNSMIFMTRHSSNHNHNLNHNHQIISNKNKKDEGKIECVELKMKDPKKRIDMEVVAPILDSSCKFSLSSQIGEQTSSSKHKACINTINESTSNSLSLDGGDNHDALPSSISPKKKKTKLIHTSIIKIRSNEVDQVSKEVPKDGHVWNKYGQKEINLSAHPRSYYRCARFRDVGCLAKKHVQRSNDDWSIFVVTYQGNHTCLPQPIWEFPYILSLPEMALHCLHDHTSPLGTVLENRDIINNIFKVESPLANCQTQMGFTGDRLLNQECVKLESTLMPSSKLGLVNSGAHLIEPKRDALLNANSHTKQVQEVAKTLKQHASSILASGNNKGKGISNVITTYELQNDHIMYHHHVPHPYQELVIKEQDHEMQIFSPDASKVSRHITFEMPLMMEDHHGNEAMQSNEALLESQVDLSINHVSSLEESVDWFLDDLIH